MSTNSPCVALDTHPFLFWLLDPATLTKRATGLLAQAHMRVVVPAMVLLETQYLIEIGRIDADMAQVIAYVKTTKGWEIHPFDETVLIRSLSLTDKRDPFDRTILATAMAIQCPIITRDRWMTERYDKCLW